MPKPNISQLARKHGLKPVTVYSRLRQGKTLQEALCEPVRGYFARQWESNREAMLEKGRLSRLRTYVLTSPEGEQLTIHDLPEYCAEVDWNYGSVQVCARKGMTYKGWTIRKLPLTASKTVEPRQQT